MQLHPAPSPSKLPLPCKRTLTKLLPSEPDAHTPPETTASLFANSTGLSIAGGQFTGVGRDYNHYNHSHRIRQGDSYLTVQSPAMSASGAKLPIICPVPVLPEAGATSMFSSRSQGNSPPTGTFLDPAVRITASSMDPFLTQPATPVDEAVHLAMDQEDCVHEVSDSGSCPGDKEPGFIAPGPGSRRSVLQVFFFVFFLFCFLLTG